MKKTFITLALIACAMMLVSCGNNGKKSEAKQAKPSATTTAAAEKAQTLGDVNDQNYVELIKARCGVDPTPGDGMTLDKASASPGNANLKFKGAKGIEEKDLQKFMLFYEAMKRVITEAYCTDGEVVNEMGSMDVLPTYGMSMDYGKVIISINPKKNYGLIVTYTDQINTVEERKLRYDPVE